MWLWKGIRRVLNVSRNKLSGRANQRMTVGRIRLRWPRGPRGRRRNAYLLLAELGVEREAGDGWHLQTSRVDPI